MMILNIPRLPRILIVKVLCSQLLYYSSFFFIYIFSDLFLILFYLCKFFVEEELGSSEESGKDWSDLEREAAEEDKERGEDRYRDDYSSSKKKKASRRQSPSPSKDRYA